MQIHDITHPTLRYGFARIAPLFTAGILIAPNLSAQATSDIFISKITGEDDGPRFSTPVNITHREGYDNQPSFTPDGRAILYTSIRDGQADSWRYDLARETLTRITTTPESEYSPTVMPSGTTFSAVRVEADSTQRLWSFDLDGDNPQILLYDIKPVGYHAWADASTLALFVLGPPPTLQLADVTSGTARVMASNIGRSIHKVPNRHAISFLHRISQDETWISLLDLETDHIRRLVQPLGQNEFYAWMQDGILIMGNGTRLYTWRVDSTESWQEVADFAGTLSNISRLAVSPDGRTIAIVAQP